MTEQQDLIQKIKELKGVQPSEKWLSSTRENLINRVNLSHDFISQESYFNWLTFPRLTVLAASLMIVFLVGSGFMIEASRNSLPGELLYPIKKITERAQNQITSKENQAELKADFASRRLEELNKMSVDSLTPEEKAEKTEQVVNDFNNNLADISSYIKNVPKEKVAAVAEKTRKIKENLTKTKDEASLAFQGKLEEAGKLVEKINSEILAALVRNEKEEKDKNASTTDQETIIFLEDKPSEKTITSTEEILKP